MADNGPSFGEVVPFPRPKPSTPEDKPGQQTEETLPLWITALVEKAVSAADWSDASAEDAEAVKSPSAFRRRYWFLVDPSRRGRIVAFQRTMSLTDFEVTLLWWTRSLEVDLDEVRITAPLALRVWGHLLAGFLALLALSALLAVLASGHRSVAQFGVLVGIELTLTGLIALAHLVYVMPHQLRRRVERIKVQALQSG